MSQLFGPVRQMGYVVHDIESAMRHWTQTMHIGPFYYVDRVPFMDFLYHGEMQRPEVSIALTYSGNVQIELIQQHDHTPSTYQAFTAAGYDGLHHLGYFSERFDCDLQRAAEAGLTVEQYAAAGDAAGRSAYFASAGHAGSALRLIALDSGNRDLYRMIQTEAEHWDGSGQIRRIDL